MQAEPIDGAAAIGQSGGPTAVINQSLVGVIEGLRGFKNITKIYGMRHGVAGLTRGELVDLTDISQEKLDLVARTPSAALGSTRDKPDEDYCARIVEACREHDIRYYFYIGGNDSSDACRIVNEIAANSGYELRCFHVPKTVDNDLMENDHTPGYPSAARFVATAFMADGRDNASLPGIKINVVMGRHAGFLTAASVLARRDENDGPHLIYLPEVPFEMDRFVEDVDRVFSKVGRCQIAVSEGIQDESGEAIGAKLISAADRDAHGNVQLSGSGALGDQLASLLKAKLTPAGGKPPRVRADTFGYLQRCWPDASPIDAQEARGSGRHAAHLAARGDRDGSVAIKRIEGPDGEYHCEFKRVELSAVAAKTRLMPREFIGGHNDVTQAFVAYARPLVGELPEFGRL